MVKKEIIKKIDNIGWIFGSAVDFARNLERFWEEFVNLPDGGYAFWGDGNETKIIKDCKKLTQPTWRCEYWHNFVIEDGVLCTIFGCGVHSVYIAVSLETGNLLYVEPDQIPSERCWGGGDHYQRLEKIYRLWNGEG